MRIDEVFKEENADRIFNEFGTGEYIAYIYDYFSCFGGKDDYGTDWAWQFGAGRYVILVLQRHSLYECGRCIYRNISYDSSAGIETRHRRPCYIIMLDKAQEYTVKGWGSKLVSHIVQDKNDTLQCRVYFDIAQAEKEAVRYSLQGYKAAVMGWAEDHNMY